MNNESLPVLAILISVISAVAQYFGFIIKMQRDISELQVKMDVFWDSASKKMAAFLVSVDTPELDKVLKNFLKGCTLTIEELDLIERELPGEIRRSVRSGDRPRYLVASMMLDRFRAEKILRQKEYADQHERSV